MEIDSVGEMMDEDMETPRSRSVVKRDRKKTKLEKSLARSESRAHKSLVTPRDKTGFSAEGQDKIKKMNYAVKAGESDRHIQCKKPKHLFSGKRGSGKTDLR